MKGHQAAPPSSSAASRRRASVMWEAARSRAMELDRNHVSKVRSGSLTANAISSLAHSGPGRLCVLQIQRGV